MSESTSPLRRPFLWMQAFAILALTVFASLALRTQQQRLEQQVRATVAEEVAARVVGWEGQLRDQLDGYLETVANSPPSEAAVTQARVRERHPWFDSLYVWRPPAVDATTNTRRPGRILFPEPPPPDDPRTRRHPCITRAQSVAMLTQAGPERAAEQYLRRCAEAPLAVRIFATGEAAQLYHRVGQYEAALAALEGAELPADLTVASAAAQGIAPFQVVVHQLRRAQVLDELGRAPEAVALWYRLGVEIASLDASQAEDVLRYDWQILRELDLHAPPAVASDARRRLSRARRRARAWDEIQRRIVPQSTIVAPSAGRFAYDQYEDIPYVLYYAPVRDAALGGAIVLDQPSLLEDLRGALGELAEHIQVVDANGQRVTGAQLGSEVAVRVDFPTTLTHLRLEVGQEALDERLARFGNQTLPLFGALIVFVAIGLGGLVAQARADRRQQELLLRQREFTTRVTHELKTPLAGMRLMAENIELGAFRDANHRDEMARRIQDEADRLRARVDEILSVSREDSLPHPVPFDPEEAVLEAIDAWAPRYEAAGVALHADLHATEEVNGDAAAVRDAVGCLLDNALKYRREDRADASVWLTLTPAGRCVEITVTDNGLGVPPKMRKAVFERFVRVEGPNRGMAGGHGLGLAQVARVARQHRGSVLCTEGVDGGARFVLRLPQA